MTESAHQSRPRRARAAKAALASSILPGWGHAMLGRDRAARALLFVDGSLVIGLLIAVFFFQVELLKAWVTPSALLWLIAVNAGVFLYRGIATIDSFARPIRRSGWDWAGGVVAALVVVAPHLMVGSVVLTQYDFIDSVFARQEPTASPQPTTTTTSAGTATSGFGATTTSGVASTTTTERPKIWDGRERLNIMLLGSDAGEGRIGTRTDSITLVSVEPTTGNVAMFSIPRNLTEAPLPEGMGLWDCRCFPDIIAHLWANGEWYPEAFPGPQEPSVNALKAAVGLIFDLEVHYYAKVDLKGFVGVVDALGGVTIDVPERIVDPIYPHEDGGTESLVFETGLQHLDGHHALAYSRIRRNSGDFARMHRQRCVLGALVRQTGPFQIFRGFSDLTAAVKENVVTDIPVDRLGDLVEILPRVSTANVASLRITRYNYGFEDNPGYQLYDLERIRADAETLMEDPRAALGTLDGFGLDDSCEESFE